MMKKTLLLSALALGLTVPAANAVTIEDFGSPKVGVVTFFSWTNSSKVPWLSQGNHTFVPTTASNGSRYLRINNVLGDYVFGDPNLGDFFGITISNNRVSFNNTQQVSFRNGTQNLSVYVVNVQNIQSGSDIYSYVLIPHDGSYYLPSLTTTLTETSDGYRIETGPFDIAVLRLRNNSYTLYDGFYEIGGMAFDVFTPNASVTEVEYELDQNMREKYLADNNYKVRVDINDDIIKIVNFWNAGHPYDLWMNRDYTFDYNVEDFEFKLNKDDLTFTATKTPEVFYTGMDDWLYSMSLSKSYNRSNNTDTKITGKMTQGEPSHSGTGRWMNVNNNKTYRGATILNVDDYITYYSATDADVPFIPNSIVKNTVIKLDPEEYTHDLNIKATAFGYGRVNDGNGKPYDDKNYIYINASLENIKNDAFVESHELYIMPTVANPNYNSAAFGDKDNGHINGTRIDLPEYFTYYPNYPADKKAGMSKIPGMDGYEIPENPFEGNVYNVLIPEDALTMSDSNQRYSLYVKTNYTPESGLEPTFHSLTALTSTPTGVEDILDNGVADEDAPVVYYNMNGVEVSGDALTPGLYIRKQGNNVTKVIIK